MKKVSAKLFFAVMWKGLCQAIGRICRELGYKGQDKRSKCVWRLFVLFFVVIIGLNSIFFTYEFGEEVYSSIFENSCGDDGTCYHSEYLYGDIYFHNTADSKGYIYNASTGEKLVKHVVWIALPEDNDSLVCFSNGRKRGYFSKNTGKLVIEPKYSHAWVFSDGVACVEEEGFLKFIDSTGKVVIDKKMTYKPNKDEHVFHGGYCVINTDDGERYGLMDKTGKVALPMEYSYIYPTNDYDYWFVQKDDMMALLDKDLKTIMPLMEGRISIEDRTINVTMPDHTIRKYDMHGSLINDFYLTYVRMLEYEKDEIVYRNKTTTVETDDDVEVLQEDYYHPKVTARLRAYGAGEDYEGLMTADGHVVTMPLYHDIEAIGYDLYLCTTTNDDKVIVNGRGEIVR